ncbi:MAG: ATP-dependent Clp protease proteolytic subunit [Gammaproteobacteria bacterium]|nr:ATP-dependent Clp protease proteolytic subunit [Gammaproteobacteria bacterium]
MPTWSEILQELDVTSVQGQPDFDGVRRKYLVQLYQYTKRNVILYASGWLQKRNAPPELTSINDEDVQALMEVCYALDGNNLDLIIHSPGGSPEAAEAIVSYLRSHFSDIRVIVPQLAMSAATMIACSGDQIMLGKHSSLGPTDPQILTATSLGVRALPA